MNALGHIAVGFAASYPEQKEMRLDNYEDADGNVHPNISDNPFIILQADNSNKLRVLRQALSDADIRFVDFTNTMVVGGYLEQQERTKATSEAELEYWGIVTFGETEKINALTKKFSLWRG